MPSEPTWKITIASGCAIVVATIAGWSEVAGKSDKKETEDLRAKYHDMDKGIVRLSEKQDWALDGQKNIEKKLDFLIEELLRRREPGNFPPGATPSPLNK